MLKRIRLKDFKSFVDEEVEVAPLTLLVGANASGKSNFFDALRFLQGLRLDLTLSEVLNGERQSRPGDWPGIRGRAEEAARIGKEVFTISSTWLVPKPESNSESRAAESTSDQAEIRHYIEFSTVDEFLVKEELVESTSSRSIAGLRTDSFIRGDIRVRQSLGPPVVMNAKKNLISNLFNRSNNLSSDNIELLAYWIVVLTRMLFLDIRPTEMRGYGTRDRPLGDNGGNLSGVLADLSVEGDEKESLLSWLIEFCAPEMADIDFVEVKELGDVMAMFIEKDGKRISARSISDGTLYFLGILLALRTAKPGSVILIEEIEAGLHPTRIRLLVEYLETVTRERQIQVIATTHSPVVLQWLSDESLRNAIVFGRVPDHEGTIMRLLGDLQYFNEIVERTGIEEMFTTGWLEMAL
jgi:hypothetical protein